MSPIIKRPRSSFSLHQLELFASVARNGSFSRAAEEMHLTQSAVSVQIRHLEEAVGVPLFEYVSRRLYLTDAGRELEIATGEVFGSLGRFEAIVADMQGLKQGRLSLMVTTTAKYFIPRLLGTFCERYPGIDVKLRVAGRDEVLRGIENNTDDLYVMGWSPDRSGVTTIPFRDNELVVIARSDHPLVGKRRIPLARLAEEAFLMREPESGTRIALERLFAEHAMMLNVRMELSSNEAIKQAVLGGLGIAVLSRQALTPDSLDGEIAILDVARFPIRSHWQVVHLTEKRLSVAARAFIDFLMHAERVDMASAEGLT